MSQENEVMVSGPILVVPSYEAVRQLIQGEAEHITIGTPVAVGEDGIDAQQNIQTYVMFQHFDQETGKLEALQFQMANPDEQGQETEQGGTGVIFGGFIEEDDIKDLGEDMPMDDGVVRKRMTLENFSVGLTSIALKMAFEKLGIVVETQITKDNVSLFSVPQREGEARDSLILYATVPVTKEQLDQLIEAKNFDKTVYHKVGLMGVSVGDLICSFNLDRSIHEFATALVERHGLDGISASIVRFLTIQSVNEVIGPVRYSDILPALRNARARAATEAQAAAAAANQVEQADAPDEAPVEEAAV